MSPIARLEARTLLSTSIPLNASSWTAIGPGPNVDNDPPFSTGYVENASGRITAIAPHPAIANTIYIAAAGGGVWKTENGGDNWIPLTETQSTLFAGALALAPSSPNIIYAGTGEANLGPSKIGNFRDNIYPGHGILKSVDGGGSWTLLTGTGDDGSLNNFERRAFSQIVVHPINPDIVYAAVGYTATNGLSANTGIWKSTNGGLIWTKTTADISSTAAFTDLVIHPTNPQILYAAVGGYAADGSAAGDPANGIYKTTDGGTSWNLLVDPILPTGTATGRIALAIAKSNPQVLYAAITNPSNNHLLGLRRTANGGNTWATVLNPGSICPDTASPINYLGSAGDYHNALAVDPTDPNIVYAGGHCLIARSALGGTWFAVGDGNQRGPHRDHHALVFDAQGKLLDGNDGGIWRLFDPDQDDPKQHDPHLLNWKNLNGNLQITQFIGIALHPSNADFAYGGTQDTGTQRFQDSFEWRRLLRGDGGASAVSASNPDRIYLITRLSSTGPFFRRSDDGGNTWAPKMSGITVLDANFYPPLVLDPNNSDRLVLGTKSAYETVTAGDRWTAIGAFSDRIDSLALAASDSDGNTIYVVTGGAVATATAHLFVTFDHGASWQQIDIPGVTDHLRGILVDPTDRMTAYVVRDRYDGGHVFRTTNGGQNWTDISGDLPNVPANCITLDQRLSPSKLYIGTDAGVYASTDRGAHWTVFQTGLPNVQVVDLKLSTTLNILAAGTHGRGVWEICVDASCASGPRGELVRTRSRFPLGTVR